MQENHHEFTEHYFFTPTFIERSGAVWPVRFGRNIAKPHYHVGPKVTTYYSLHFVLEGSGMFIQDQQTYPLLKNDIFCLFPKKTLEYYTDKHNPLQMVWVAFSGKLAINILERIGLRPDSPHVSGAVRPVIIDILNDFFKFVRDNQQNNSDFGRLAFFYKLFETISETTFPIDQKKKTEGAADWLQEGIDYLQMHFAEGISVVQVSAHVGVERTYFSKKFQETYGVSPIKYIQQLKMNRAKQMMQDTDYTLTEIARSVGYPDLFSFSKAFKKHFAESPTQFRNRDC